MPKVLVVTQVPQGSAPLELREAMVGMRFQDPYPVRPGARLVGLDKSPLGVTDEGAHDVPYSDVFDQLFSSKQCQDSDEFYAQVLSLEQQFKVSGHLFRIFLGSEIEIVDE